MSGAHRSAYSIQLPTRYRVERVIGRGGAATVLAAFDQRLQRKVAIKVFSESSGSLEVMLDQEREARLLAGLSHPALVTVYDIAQDSSSDGVPRAFLVMEYVDGPDLAQWLRANVASTAQVVTLGAALTDALRFVHSAGVLHCDIKPSNVLLRIGGRGELHPKLSDFGLAAVFEGEVPQGEFTVGTAAYLSPERVEGHPLRTASDVYALGLVLLEAATGQVAFPGSVVESAFARLTLDPDIPEQLPMELAEIFRGMTARDASRRWTLDQAHEAFGALASPPRLGDAVQAAPLPLRERVEEPEALVTSPALRTITPEHRLQALERVTSLASRKTGSTGAFLLADDGVERSLQAVHGLAHDAVSLLTAQHRLNGSMADLTYIAAGDGSSADSLVARPVTGTRGEPLGVLVLVRRTSTHLDEDELRTMADCTIIAGQVLELRSAARRALLSR